MGHVDGGGAGGGEGGGENAEADERETSETGKLFKG